MGYIGDSAAFMRRAKAFIVIIALLAIPLALLARGGACEQTQCMCCLMHAKQEHGKAMSCSHCTGRGKCGIGATTPDYGLIAPIAPTSPAALFVIAEPERVRQPILLYSQAAVPGFDSAPFVPPRV